MQIRVANRQDEPAIRAIINDALRERGKPEVETGGADRDLANIEATYFWNDGIFLVAEEDGAVVGLAAASRGDNEQTLFLRRLAVRPEFRKRGVARKLLDTVLFFAGNLEYQRVVMDPAFQGLDETKPCLGFAPSASNPRLWETPVRSSLHCR